MKVYGRLSQEVEINPSTVIEKLIEQEIQDGYVFKRSGKFILKVDGRMGYEKEISEELYDYVNALTYVKNYLRDKQQ